MSDTRLNLTGLTYFFNRLKTLFATKTELGDLEDRVDDIVAEGGEPNTIESISLNGTPITPDGNKNVALTEADPTVPAWAKASSKPTYTAQEVGALPSSTTIPSKVSDLTNDSGFQTASDVSSAISAAVGSAYKFKGSVATVADLPNNAEVGDVYDVQATGTNYAWTGTAWDALGQLIDTSTLWAKSELVAITTAQIDTIVES